MRIDYCRMIQTKHNYDVERFRMLEERCRKFIEHNKMQ